jgi:hypothetical protein
MKKKINAAVVALEMPLPAAASFAELGPHSNGPAENLAKVNVQALEFKRGV